MKPELIFKGKEVLIVDDNAFIGKMLQKILKQMGFTHVAYHQTAIDALEFLQKQKMDVIITDWAMPQINGREFIQLIRQSEYAHATPILLITESPNEHQAKFCHSHNVSSILKKPFSVNDLRLRLEYALSVQPKNLPKPKAIELAHPSNNDEKFILSI